MHEVSQERFLEILKPGDIGINLSVNPFAKLQDWYRKKYKEGEHKASHGFILENPPGIIEANGVKASRGKLIKFIAGRTKLWIFRHKDITPMDVKLMLASARANVDGGGHYSVEGILQMAWQFIGFDKKITDKPGNFCTELTSRCIMETALPYMDIPAHRVTPSLQLNWFLNNGAKLDWLLVGHYNGAGLFMIADEVISLQLYQGSDLAKDDRPSKSA